MKTFYFTATGNSLYVAKRIGGELYSIPQILKEKEHKFEDEAIGFVFPCHGFGIPRMVIDFMQKFQFTANYFFAVMTYGNKAAAGLNHLAKVGKKTGVYFNYTNEILMIDNYLPIFKIEDQLAKESSKKIEAQLNRIVSDILTRQTKTTQKGIATTAFSRVIYKLFTKHNYDRGDKNFIIKENCNGCKVCEKVCPKSNIVVEGNPEFLHKCDVCYACIHHCPQGAIHLKSERSGARFINRNVKLKEIIDANNNRG